MLVINFLVTMILLGGFVLFCSMHDHLLSALLSLEFMVLGVFLFFLVSMGWAYYLYSLVYLVMAACEGALGLSILVVMSRTHGGDYLKSFSLLD